jgi:hypothetical protein
MKLQKGVSKFTFEGKNRIFVSKMAPTYERYDLYGGNDR